MKKQTTTEAAAEWVEIDSLKPWDQNPRKNDAAVPKVVESIKRFGFGAPILARKADREVIAGHTRLKAAQQLGIKKVPVRFLDLDPAEAHLLALADNKLSEVAEWDGQALLNVLSEFGLESVEIAGWSQAEFDELTGGVVALASEPKTHTKEIDAEAFTGAHTCPRCSFEFND